MGAMAESFVAYAQPLIDGTDGSPEQLQRALQLGQLFWNFALLPQEELDDSIAKLQTELKMNDEDARMFRIDMVEPMMQRHRKMYPLLHARRSTSGAADHESTASGIPLLGQRQAPKPPEMYPGTERYAPCPCNSGRKYKFCCGKSR